MYVQIYVYIGNKVAQMYTNLSRPEYSKKVCYIFWYWRGQLCEQLTQNDFTICVRQSKIVYRKWENFIFVLCIYVYIIGAFYGVFGFNMRFIVRAAKFCPLSAFQMSNVQFYNLVISMLRAMYFIARRILGIHACQKLSYAFVKITVGIDSSGKTFISFKKNSISCFA